MSDFRSQTIPLERQVTVDEIAKSQKSASIVIPAKQTVSQFVIPAKSRAAGREPGSGMAKCGLFTISFKLFRGFTLRMICSLVK